MPRLFVSMTALAMSCADPCGCTLDIVGDRLTLTEGQSDWVQVDFHSTCPFALFAKSSGAVSAEFEGGLDHTAGRGPRSVGLQVTCTREGSGTVTVQANIWDSPCVDAIEVDCQGATTTPYYPTTTETTYVTPEPGEPMGLPDGTTDCEVDGEGCLIAGDATCSLVLDEPASADALTLIAEGTLFDGPATSALDLLAYTAPDPYSTPGPGCSISRSSTLVTRAALDDFGIAVGFDQMDGPSGDLDVRLVCEIDNAMGEVAFSTEIGGSPSSPVSASGLPTADGDQIIVELWRARLCSLEVQ